MNLEHIKVLVTGASRGVGAAIAKTCAKSGAKLVLHYNSGRAKAEEIASQIGENCIGIIGEDLSQSGAGERLWQAASEQAGSINALVNNAGIDLVTDPYGNACEWQENWDKIMMVNLQAPADICRAALIDFREAKNGRIVNICSRASIRGDSIDHMAYAASKGGLLALTKTIARGAAGDGVLAYALTPGWINTEMAPTDPEILKAAKSEIPLGEFAEVEEIATMVAFLLSDACPSATGASFDINGASHVR